MDDDQRCELVGFWLRATSYVGHGVPLAEWTKYVPSTHGVRGYIIFRYDNERSPESPHVRVDEERLFFESIGTPFSGDYHSEAHIEHAVNVLAVLQTRALQEDEPQRFISGADLADSHRRAYSVSTHFIEHDE